MTTYDSILCDLAAMPLFADMAHNHLDLLSQMLYPKRFVARAQIFHEEDDVTDKDGLYVIVAGRVEISAYTSGSESDEVRNQIVQLLYAGDFFGEYGLITGSRRNASATAAVDTDVLILPKCMYRYYREHKMGFTLALQDVLFAGMSQRQIRANEFVLLRKIFPVRRRLITFLLLMARPCPTHPTISVIDHLSHAQIAVLLGVERRSIGRGLRELEQESLITQSRYQSKHIYIPSPRRLEEAYEEEKRGDDEKFGEDAKHSEDAKHGEHVSQQKDMMVAIERIRAVGDRW